MYGARQNKGAVKQYCKYLTFLNLNISIYVCILFGIWIWISLTNLNWFVTSNAIFLMGFVLADFVISCLLFSLAILQVYQRHLKVQCGFSVCLLLLWWELWFYQAYAGCKLFWKMHKFMLISYARMNISKTFWFISKGKAIRLPCNYFLSQVTSSVLQIDTIKEYDCQIVACNK